MQIKPTYFRTTDVQRTWRLYGWIPPSDLPEVREKWRRFATLNTEQEAIERANKRHKK